MNDTSCLVHPLHIGTVIEESCLSDVDSLVRIRISDANDNITQYVMVITHITEKPATFSFVEIVTDVDSESIFRQRALFKGRLAYEVINKERQVVLKLPSIKFI